MDVAPGVVRVSEQIESLQRIPQHRTAMGASIFKSGWLAAGLAVFVTVCVPAQPAPESAAGTLAAMRGKSRPLLIFYPQYAGERPLDPAIQRQRKFLENHISELKERDVVPMFIPLGRDFESIVPGEWIGLRKQFHIDDRKFTVVLLGKDGGEKFRSHAPVTIEKLDALIDAMPMRQQEVQNGHAK